MKIKRILVPVDFSANSLHALDYAVDFSKPFKAELMVLFVVEPIYYAVPDFAGGAAAAIGGAARRAAPQRPRAAPAARAALRQAPHQAARAPADAAAAYQAIVDTAKKVKADLIVMATHGRTGVSHLLLGSVAERVVRAAPCPVLTVRAGKTAAAAHEPRKSQRSVRARHAVPRTLRRLNRASSTSRQRER